MVNSYSYTDTNWSDKLTAFNGNTITYDAIGNPLQYHDGKVFTWTNGRALASVTDGTSTYEYTYDSNGNRIKKKVNGATTQYIMSDGLMLGEVGPDGYLFYFFDESGRKYGFILNSSQRYYYEYNLQGDVIGIYDSTGTKVVTYTYDAWGKLLSIDGSAADTVGLINPIRYRGYYYDIETGFYFLQTRCYDPNIGRFINSDNVIPSGEEDVQGYNLFSYCLNNPINMSDEDGHWPKWIKSIAKAVVVAVVVTVAVAATAGVAAVALGASTAVASAVVTSATVGGLASSAANITTQAITKGPENIDTSEVALNAFVGSATGAISGGVSPAASALESVSSQFLRQKAQLISSALSSQIGYIMESAITGDDITFEGVATTATTGTMSGVPLNLPEFKKFLYEFSLGLAEETGNLIRCSME